MEICKDIYNIDNIQIFKKCNIFSQYWMSDISLEKNYLLLWLSSTLLQRRFQLCIGSHRAIEGNCTLCKCFELLCLFIWTCTICHCHFIICTSLWKWFYLVRGDGEKSQAVSVLDAESESESVFFLGIFWFASDNMKKSKSVED